MENVAPWPVANPTTMGQWFRMRRLGMWMVVGVLMLTGSGPAGARTVRKERTAAAWLSFAHPGLGEWKNQDWGFFFDNCPQRKFWLGFIPIYGWPGYLQVISIIDAYRGRTSDNLTPID